MNIMVTGVGSIIGYGVLKSLQNKGFFLVGSDIYKDAVGQQWSDQFLIAPLTSSEQYSSWLHDVIQEYNIDLLIPAIEQDVHFLSDNRRFVASLSTAVVLNNEKLVNLTKDKWLTFLALQNINIELKIDSSIDGDFKYLKEKYGCPFLLKPRKGYASKGHIIVDTELKFDAYKDIYGEQLLAQPLVGSKDQEYTVGIFGDGTGDLCASISLKRYLAIDGSTAKAQVVFDDSLDTEVKKLCKHFKPLGPTNFQFRRVEEQWKLLEINPRISSSTSLRTAFGFNDSMMCVDFYLNGNKVVQPSLKAGSASRYIEDRIVYDSDNF